MDKTALRCEEVMKLTNLTEVVTHHIGRRDDLPALTQYHAPTKTWVTITYGEFHQRICRWERAFAKLGLERGARVAMLLANGTNSLCFDQGALRNALVPVPLHAVDTPGSSAFILNDSEARVLVTGKYLKWKGIRAAETLPHLKLVVITDDEVPAEDPENGAIRVVTLEEWLADAEEFEVKPCEIDPESLAALVYTSGTTGRPKGVMLTHKNILSCAKAVLANIRPTTEDRWFSFLPMSHTFERTTTYYLALAMGNQITFNRTILQIAEDMRIAKPTVLMSVPRIYERIYSRVQDTMAKKPALQRFVFNWAVEVGWRRFCKANDLPVEHSALEILDPLVAGFLDKKVGSTIRQLFGTDKPHAFISGGAALPQNVARFFIGLGLPIYQGYGMTETSPVMTVNPENGLNKPHTVGTALPCVELRIGDNDELQARGDSVMKGYWKREDATREIFTEDGWLKTGDQADILPTGHVRIKGRIKEIIVTSTGEKIPPADLEMLIEQDPLISQTMAVGEDLPYITAIAVLEPTEWAKAAAELGLDAKDPASLQSKAAVQMVTRRIKRLTRGFPQYGVPRSVVLTLDPWTIDNGMLTPTLKLKRHIIRARFQDEIAKLYAGQ